MQMRRNFDELAEALGRGGATQSLFCDDLAGAKESPLGELEVAHLRGRFENGAAHPCVAIGEDGRGNGERRPTRFGDGDGKAEVDTA